MVEKAVAANSPPIGKRSYCRLSIVLTKLAIFYAVAIRLVICIMYVICFLFLFLFMKGIRLHFYFLNKVVSRLCSRPSEPFADVVVYTCTKSTLSLTRYLIFSFCKLSIVVVRCCWRVPNYYFIRYQFFVCVFTRSYTRSSQLLLQTLFA